MKSVMLFIHDLVITTHETILVKFICSQNVMKNQNEMVSLQAAAKHSIR